MQRGELWRATRRQFTAENLGNKSLRISDRNPPVLWVVVSVCVLWEPLLTNVYGFFCWRTGVLHAPERACGLGIHPWGWRGMGSTYRCLVLSSAALLILCEVRSGSLYIIQMSRGTFLNCVANRTCQVGASRVRVCLQQQKRGTGLTFSGSAIDMKRNELRILA